MNICSIGGCEKRFYGKGYCKTHYNKLYRSPLLGKCYIENCDKNVVAMKMCCIHYRKWKLYGDANFIKIKEHKKPSFEILMDKFNDDSFMKEKCWEWHGRLTNCGYGHVFYAGSTTTAHRISYKYFKGNIPKKMNVCHLCDNKKCFNPAHLWLGTTQDNIKDAYSKGLISTRKGSKNHYSKLKEYQVFEIRKMIKEGMGNTEIAEKYDVGDGAISCIRHKKTWSHIKEK